VSKVGSSAIVLAEPHLPTLLFSTLLFYTVGKLDDALTNYQKALTIFQTIFKSKDHINIGSMHYNIALVKQQQLSQESPSSNDNNDNKNETLKNEARYNFQTAYNIWKQALGPDHPQTKMAEQAIEQLEDSNSTFFDTNVAAPGADAEKEEEEKKEEN
jgi:tetratricopeptide (TPR) repeat protein